MIFWMCFELNRVTKAEWITHSWSGTLVDTNANLTALCISSQLHWKNTFKDFPPSSIFVRHKLQVCFFKFLFERDEMWLYIAYRCINLVAINMGFLVELLINNHKDCIQSNFRSVFSPPFFQHLLTVSPVLN